MKVLSTLLAAAAFVLATPALAQSDGCTPREVATEFFDAFYVKKQPRKAFETWVIPEYVQHNPLAATGRAPAIAFLEPFFESTPGASYSIKRMLVDGDLVAVHSHLKMTPDDRGMAVVDIVRVENCKIVEHWDVIQPVPEQALNDNGMF